MKIANILLAVAVPAFLQLLFIYFAPKAIGLSALGYVFISLNLIAFFQQITTQVPFSAFSRFYYEVDDSKLFIKSFLANIRALSIIAALLLVITSYFTNHLISHVLIVPFVFLLFVELSFFTSVFNVQGEQGFFAISRICETAARYTLPLLLYFFSYDSYMVLALMFLGYFISLSICHYFYKWDFVFSRPSFLIKNWEQYKFSSYSFLSVVGSWVIMYSDRYYILDQLGSSEVASYSLLFNFAAIFGLVSSIYTYYFNPIYMKKSAANIDEAISYTVKRVFIFFIVCMSIFILLISIPGEVFGIILDTEVLGDNIRVLHILLLAFVFQVIQNAIAIFFVILKRLDIYGYCYLFVASGHFLFVLNSQTDTLLGFAYLFLVSNLMIVILMIFSFVYLRVLYEKVSQ